MKRSVTILALLMLLAGTAVKPARASAQGGSRKLQPAEYDTVALIYNQELSALGGRALYPICVGLPTDTPTRPLLEYLRRGGYAVSELSVCEPSAGPAGSHPKDYPHGLRIFIDKLQRAPGGQVNILVEATDLTLRPGEHFGSPLRRGTYHFKQSEKGEWQVSSYTKEYDSKDEKQGDCKAAEPSGPLTK